MFCVDKHRSLQRPAPWPQHHKTCIAIMTQLRTQLPPSSPRLVLCVHCFQTRINRSMVHSLEEFLHGNLCVHCLFNVLSIFWHSTQQRAWSTHANRVTQIGDALKFTLVTSEWRHAAHISLFVNPMTHNDVTKVSTDNGFKNERICCTISIAVHTAQSWFHH